MKRKIIFVILLFAILVYLIIFKYMILTSEIKGDKYKTLSNIKIYSNKSNNIKNQRLDKLLKIAVKDGYVNNNEYINIKYEYDILVFEEEKLKFLNNK